MRKLLYIIVCVFFSLSLKAQEPAIFTHYHLNPVLINPGATAAHDNHMFLANYRSKWSAFPGAPKTFTFSYDGAMTDRLGLGAQVLSDQIGANRILQFQLNYAYKFEVDLYHIGIGLSTGIQNFKLVDVANDPFLDPTDILLAEGMDGVQFFDGSFGIYGDYDERFVFGLSLPNVIRTRINDIQGDIEDDQNDFNYMLYLGYRFDVANYNFTVEPSILVKNVRYVPFQTDINLKMSFLDDQLIGGLTYSFGAGNRLGFLIGTRIDDLRLHYSYDVNFGEFQQYNNGSHEFSISYMLFKNTNAPSGPTN